MRRVAFGGLFVFVALVAAKAQEPATTSAQTNGRPMFEVASIKRSAPDAPPGRAGLMPGGRYVLVNGPLRILINVAYPSLTNEIVNAPDWVTRENYDVTAVAGPTTTFPQVAEMMKALLTDRTRLAAHYETRDWPVYELVIATEGMLGPALRRASVDCDGPNAPALRPPPRTGPVGPCVSRTRSGEMISGGVPIDALAVNLRNSAGRVVINRTGLTGAYEFTLSYAPTTVASDPTEVRPSLFTALQEQLGLKLVTATAPLPVLVIDRIERPTQD
jgi:uncharacterized protein (TIGR03435 family)